MACTVTGQGAGAAAAVSIKVISSVNDKLMDHQSDQEGVSTHDVDIKKVQEELLRQGVKIH